MNGKECSHQSMAMLAPGSWASQTTVRNKFLLLKATQSIVLCSSSWTGLRYMSILWSSGLIELKKILFRTFSDSLQNWEEDRFSIYPLPQRMQGLPPSSSFSRCYLYCSWWTYPDMMIMESTVYLKVCPWWCAFCAFVQMRKGMYPPSECLSE